jgi:hypothetical protein
MTLNSPPVLRVLVHVGLVFLDDRITGLIRMQRIRERALDRLVVRGTDRPPSAERHEQTSDAFGIHDERAHVIFGRGIGLEVGNVDADPGLLGFVPPNLRRDGSQGLPSRSQDARL